MPIAIWAFITLFFRDLSGGMEFASLAFYLTCVVLANLVQALIVLPIFLKAKRDFAIASFRAMFTALSVAFFGEVICRSFAMMAIKCAQERASVTLVWLI